MNKRILSAIVLTGMIATSSAFASRARINVMGTGDAGQFLQGGSFIYDDAYNMFYNPAYVNDFKNWVTIEKRGVGATNEGGFVTSFMNMNVGFFFNRTDAFNVPFNTVTTGAFSTTTGAQDGVRPIDLIIGGDAGVKWGLGLSYANGSGGTLTQPGGLFTGTATKASSLTARAGVSVADFEPFVAFRIIGKEEDKNEEPGRTLKNEESDMQAGLKYHYGEWTPYAAYRILKGEKSGSATAANNGDTYEANSMAVGLARNSKIGENTRMIYSVAFNRLKVTDYRALNTAVKQDAGRTVIPVDLSLESDLSGWFTIRGGLQYRLMDRTSGINTSSSTPSILGSTTTAVIGTQADATTARIGGTIHAGKADVDFSFGNSTNGADGANIGFDSQTFTNVSLTYRW